MNKRAEFTKKITILLADMIQEGEYPVIDYALRSPEEQYRLFQKGRKKVGDEWVIEDKSKVVTYYDGIKKQSKHNLGLAVDIYLCDKDGKIQFEWDKKKADYWHKRWVELGGRSLWLEKNFDAPHFEL